MSELFTATIFGEKRVGIVLGSGRQKYFYSVTSEGKLSIEQLFNNPGRSNITDLTAVRVVRKAVTK